MAASSLTCNGGASGRSAAAGCSRFRRAGRAPPFLLRLGRRAGSGRRRTPVEPGRRYSMSAGRLDRSHAVASSRPPMIYVGYGRGRHAVRHRVGQRRVQVHGCGPQLDAIGSGRLATDRAVSRRSTGPKSYIVARSDIAYGPSADPRRLPPADGGRTWTGSSSRRRHRRDRRSAIKPGRSGDDVRRPVADTAAALEHRIRPPTAAVRWSLSIPDGGDPLDPVAGNGFLPGLGRIGLAVCSAGPAGCTRWSRPRGQAGVYRSEDSGGEWTRRSGRPADLERGWYFCGVTVDPRNADVVYVCDTTMYRSTAAGTSRLQGRARRRRLPSPLDRPVRPRRMIAAVDQGAR